jgi:hypothetical protein
LDEDQDGVKDAGERSVVTDTYGYYEFNDIEPGTYDIREVMKEGWRQTWPTRGYYTETFTSGMISRNNNFGNVYYHDETAWALGNNENWDYASSENWGWNNGPISIPEQVYSSVTYRYELYAGAAQNDITNGTLVGAVYAHVSVDGDSVVRVTVTFDVFDEYELRDTHVWIGATPLPIKRGQFTDAPGQLIYDDGETVVVTWTTDKYRIGSSGAAEKVKDQKVDLFIAAHGVVRIFED